MSTDISEIEAFQQFLSNQCAEGASSLTPEKAVEKFRQLQRLKEKLAISEEESRQGKSKPLDVDALMERVEKRIEAEGSNK